MIELPTYTTEQLREMREAHAHQIDVLCTTIQAMRNNRAVTNLIPFINRLVHERNELGDQRFDLFHNTAGIIRENKELREITKNLRFKRKSPRKVI